MGYCGAHRARFKRGADMDAPWSWEVTPEDRFWQKVEKTQSCWVWTGSRDRKGYGKRDGGLAHRFAYELANGPIRDGAMVDHICHNTSCVRPSHLRLANNSQNAQNLLGAKRGSKSGVRGVYWSEREKGWRADATVNGHRPYLGVYPTLAEAEDVVIKFRRENMPYSTMDRKECGT